MPANQRRQPSRLPPPVLSRRKKKRSTKPLKSKWHRHLPWLIPVAACVVFAVLIGGGLAVRQVVIVLREESPGAGVDPETVADADGTVRGGAAAETDGTLVTNRVATDPLASSEPGYEVLPPKAAKEPGRKLPKMLLVGPHVEMFSNLEAALSVAVAGDIIEIRTDGPLLVGPMEREFAPPDVPKPITIRAGGGTAPVLRLAFAEKEPLFRLKTIDLQFAGLHVATMQPGTLIECTGGRIGFERCTFTAFPPAKSLLLVAMDAEEATGGIDVTFRRCLSRGVKGAECRGPRVRVEITDSAIAFTQSFVAFRLAEEQALDVRRTTLVHTYLLNVSLEQDDWPGDGVDFTMERCLFGFVACCPSLIRLSVPPSHTPQNPTDAAALLRHAVETFDAADSIAQFWEGGLSAGGGANSFILREPVFASFPTMDYTLRFGPRVEQVRTLIHEYKSPPETKAVRASVLPSDCAVTSTGALAAARAEGRDYGCDVTQLPTPPAATLQAYEVPAGVKTKKL